MKFSHVCTSRISGYLVPNFGNVNILTVNTDQHSGSAANPKEPPHTVIYFKHVLKRDRTEL